MKLLFISSLLVAATNAADVDRRRINGITFADQAVEALNLVHKGQASQASSSTVLIKKGESGNKGGDKSSNDKSSNSKSSSSNSSGSSRDGRGVCGESDDYCKNYDSSSFLNIKKEDGGNKGGDNKSSGSSKSKSSSSSTNSRDGGRRTDRCFRACDTDRCTSADRRRLACPDSTAASSDMKFVQKGQASSSTVLIKKGDESDKPKKDDEGGDEPKTSKDENRDDKSDDKDNSKSSSSTTKSSSGTGPSGDNDRTWSGSDICKAPKNWCGGSSADGDDKCDDACDKDSGCDKEQRKHLGCDATSNDVAATKKLRRRKA